jgi:hypothetical protein
MLKALFAFYEDAINKHLFGLDYFDDLLTCFFCQKCIKNDLSLWIVREFTCRRCFKRRLWRHIAVELDVQLILDLLLETKAAQLRKDSLQVVCLFIVKSASRKLEQNRFSLPEVLSSNLGEKS